MTTPGEGFACPAAGPVTASDITVPSPIKTARSFISVSPAISWLRAQRITPVRRGNKEVTGETEPVTREPDAYSAPGWGSAVGGPL